MLTLLELANKFLAYFTPNSKSKGKVFSFIALVSVWYIAYEAYRFLVNHIWLQGLLLLLLFIFLLYFTILNVLYYFFDKNVSWDITPKLEKYLGKVDANIETEKKQFIVPTNGLYRTEDVLPSKLKKINYNHLQVILDQLKGHGLVNDDYGNLDDAMQKEIVLEKGSIASNYPGTVLPYADLRLDGGAIKIYGGINQMEAKELAILDEVGLLTSREAAQRFILSVATAVILDNKVKTLARVGLLEEIREPDLIVEIAFKPKN